ncbi:MAG: HlyC/CorC family transporter [Bacteroidetes bacterium]|nr:HlyC/CorC family transporter [Bacteroidota bacterium]MBT3747605.1 HlyC/CorC family transporter [Bacteroidota bacterium]MBT4398476.1 HlyC/CorC family transporter [Bacteroidota bacterium]MBT4409229.1 HlyC/CorC family transporter [Bacteroidota bacterium]MBT5427597.1 HlyC/CorC family transporter [Bacteroidota bacterium]
MTPWIIIIICLILSALFSGSEIAFISSNKLRIELDRKQGKSSSKLVGWLSKRPEYFIATMLVGNNISLVVYGLQMAILLEPFIAQWINSEFWILIIQTILATTIILFTAEFLPKTLFRLRPNRMISAVSPILFVFYVVLLPITWVSIILSNGLLKWLFRSEPEARKDNQVFDRIDLTHLVNQNIQRDGTEEEMDHEMKLFQNALDFSKVKLRECMIPRTEIVSIELTGKLSVLQQLFVETGFSRILVYEESIDNIIGYAHHSDLFTMPETIKQIVRPMTIVPESMPANKLLSQLLREQKNAAIVVDEFGGTAGLVTTEDVLEEIFGEIEDEHDTIELEEVRVADGEFRLSGRHEIDYLNEKLQLDLPVSDEYETLAGLILTYHESIPRIGEVIRIGKHEFRILSSTSTRINSIRLIIL